jgi:hypothetical protein
VIVDIINKLLCLTAKVYVLYCQCFKLHSTHRDTRTIEFTCLRGKRGGGSDYTRFWIYVLCQETPFILSITSFHSSEGALCGLHDPGHILTACVYKR